jgi:hypothetical protein
MTKNTYPADFRVYVRPEMWEHEAPESHFFDGIYTVRLNTHVEIPFVPDVSEFCPPWSPDLVPNGEDVATEREARVYQVLMSRYSVTPNARLAGQEEIVALQRGDEPPERGTVWYVAFDEWRHLLDELEAMREFASSDRHSTCLSQIANTHLGRFLEERFLPSGRLSAMDLRILRRA